MRILRNLHRYVKAADIHETALVSHQVVNHFSKAAAITTKCGLGRSLENCSWFGNSDSFVFWPRQHNLFDEDTIADWEADFKWSAAAAVVGLCTLHPVRPIAFESTPFHPLSL